MSMKEQTGLFFEIFFYNCNNLKKFFFKPYRLTWFLATSSNHFTTIYNTKCLSGNIDSAGTWLVIGWQMENGCEMTGSESRKENGLMQKTEERNG